jgi:hypothetical protein
MKYLILAAALSFFGVAQATCVITSEVGGEACSGTNPLGGACAWTAVAGGYICARAAPSPGVIPVRHVPRDKVVRPKQEEVGDPGVPSIKSGSKPAK